jgi:hypothetical protein
MNKNNKKLFNILFITSIFLVLGGFILFEWKFFKGFNNKVLIYPTSAAKLIINTDKNEYQLGEAVNINITNSAQNPIVEQTTSSIDIVSKRFLGNNYGVAIIEKLENGIWVAVEPVWRCDAPCYEKCKYGHTIKPGEKNSFIWPQKIIICDILNHEEKIESVESGQYRISSAVWSNEKKIHEIIHSNEFKIKN